MEEYPVIQRALGKDPGFLQYCLEKAEQLVCCLKPYMDVCEVYECHYLLDEHKQFVDMDAMSTLVGLQLTGWDPRVPPRAISSSRQLDRLEPLDTRVWTINYFGADDKLTSMKVLGHRLANGWFVVAPLFSQRISIPAESLARYSMEL
ncbi:hypothetical protein ACFLWA_03735 [Chloroflexota bacterium]